MASIRKTKKFLKNSKGFYDIYLKDESEEDGNKVVITPCDTLKYMRLGVKVIFEAPFTTIDVMFIPYYRIGKITKW